MQKKKIVPMETGGFITVRDAAQVAGCSMSRIRQLVHLGLVDARRISRRLLMVRASTIKSFAKQEPKRGRPRAGFSDGQPKRQRSA